MVTLRADPWSPEYGGDVEAPFGAAEGPAAVDATIETADWSGPIVPEVPPAAGPPALCFVDGVRRVELRLMAADGDRRGWGIAGSFAVGAVRVSAGRALIERAAVERLLAIGGAISAPDIAFRVGPSEVRYRAMAVPGDDPAAPLQALQNAMREAEARLADALASDALVVADGPLTFPFGPGAPVVGIAKRMVVSYLDPERSALLPRLRPGGRTPLFAFGHQVLDRFAWYQRLVVPDRTWHELAGIVRCEVRMSIGLPFARRLADRLAAGLPRYAGRPGIDPRAPQNLAPVGALEADLRRRMGHPELLRRALLEELDRSVEAAA